MVTITSYVANGRPDLIVEDVVISEQTEGQKIEVTVLNQGEVAAAMRVGSNCTSVKTSQSSLILVIN